MWNWNSTKWKFSNGLGDDLGIDHLEGSQPGHFEVFKPAAHCPGARQARQTTKAEKQHIPSEEVNVPKASATDDQQPQNEANHCDDTVIPPERDAVEMTTDEIIEMNGAKIADQQFQTRVRRQPRLGKLDVKISLDMGADIGFSIPHRKWPFVLG